MADDYHIGQHRVRSQFITRNRKPAEIQWPGQDESLFLFSEKKLGGKDFKTRMELKGTIKNPDFYLFLKKRWGLACCPG